MKIGRFYHVNAENQSKFSEVESKAATGNNNFAGLSDLANDLENQIESTKNSTLYISAKTALPLTPWINLKKTLKI